jgi:proteasome assembly chaperone (PAC2) family protein
MAADFTLNKPWLIAVWPGMGQVALNAGYYLLAKLEMYQVAEFSPRELFEVERVEVKGGLIKMESLPRSRFFVWKDPRQVRDIVVFIGDAQPLTGKYGFCHKLIEFAQSLRVERVFTFAAMATDMEPKSPSRVFGVATDEEGLAELKRLELTVLEDGQIGGLNGVLLGVAAERGLRGSCLLGEIPQLFLQFPFPKAALGVLGAFCALSGIAVDFMELSEQSQVVEQQLDAILTKVQAAIHEEENPEDEEESYATAEEAEEEGLNEEDERRIDELFEQARGNRSKAYELKRELDRLDVFKEYEDRFLDLFKHRA